MIVTECAADCHAITESPLFMFWSLGPTFALQNEIMYHSDGRGVTREAIRIFRGDDIDDDDEEAEDDGVEELASEVTKTTTTGTGTTTTATAPMTSTPKITINNSGNNTTMTGLC